MGFYVRFDDLRVVSEGTNQQIAKWQEQLQNAQSAIQDIVGLDSFRGQTADAAKAYFSEIHGLLLAAVGGTLVDFMSKYLLYWDGYYEIDSDIHTRLNQDTMESAIREYKTSGENLEEIQSKLRAAVNTTSDIFYPGVPATGGLENSHEEAMKLTRDTMDKVQPYESSVLAGDVKALESFIANTRSFIKSCMNGDRSIMLQYTTGDIIRTYGIYDLAVSMEAANQYSQIHKDALQEAIDRQEKVYAQLQAEYEAEMERLAKERADQGLSQMILGGVAVVVGVAAIVCTAGAATPVVVTAAVTGICTVAYGASELTEGGQHLYYGLNGDPYTSAFNPLRDTLFMGNQEVYSIWGNLNMTVAGLCIPIGQATKGASGLQAIKQGAKAVAKETLIDKASETIAAYTAPVIADTLGVESQTGQLLINMGVQSVSSGLIESTVDNIEIKRETQQIKAEAEASGKGLAGLMDEADAARYEAYFGYGDGVILDGDVKTPDSVKCIVEAVEKGEITLETTLQKGNYGEMKTDICMESMGYKRVSLDKVDSLDTPGHQGIDGVYYNPDGNPPYMVVESKYGSSQLGDTLDGKQMSDSWINGDVTGNSRLVEAVGKDMADDILFEGYGKMVVNVKPDGTVVPKMLD